MNCEGNCTETHGGHAGEVHEVRVGGNGIRPAMTFNYCQNAIEEDRRRGFTVDYSTGIQGGGEA